MIDDLSGEFPFRLFTPKLRYRLYQPDDTAARCGGFIPSGELTLPTAKAGGFSFQRLLRRSCVLHGLHERMGLGVSRPTVCFG